jgi:hypothetical protein
MFPVFNIVVCVGAKSHVWETVVATFMGSVRLREKKVLVSFTSLGPFADTKENYNDSRFGIYGKSGMVFPSV